MNSDDMTISRGLFLKYTGAAMAATMLDIPGRRSLLSTKNNTMADIKITKAGSNFERVPLNPYRFKGGAITEIWTVIAGLESDSGIRKAGLGVQGVLWSDAAVATAYTES